MTSHTGLHSPKRTVNTKNCSFALTPPAAAHRLFVSEPHQQPPACLSINHKKDSCRQTQKTTITMKLSLATFAFLWTTVQAFTVLPAARPSMTRLALMTPEETDSLMKRAEECVDSECSVDDVADLIDVLHAQQNELYNRVETIKKTIKSLETMNQADDRKVDEVRETVRAIFRVFQLDAKKSGNDYPALSKPTGYSGDVKGGGKTAYDAFFKP